LSDQLFNPAMVLSMPSKVKQSKNSNMHEAVKTKVDEIPKKIIPKKIKVIKPPVKEIIIPPVELTVEPEITPDIKRTILTKEKGKTRTSYIIDKKIVNYIDNISRELKYAEIQNYHQGIIAEEFLRIGQYLYEKYKHKLSETITSGDQVSEFVFREFRKEYDIVDDD